jgi:hypothetical protein
MKKPVSGKLTTHKAKDKVHHARLGHEPSHCFQVSRERTSVAAVAGWIRDRTTRGHQYRRVVTIMYQRSDSEVAAHYSQRGKQQNYQS